MEVIATGIVSLGIAIKLFLKHKLLKREAALQEADLWNKTFINQ